MRARSWMAALALVVGTSIAVGRAMPALVTSPDRRKGRSEAEREEGKSRAGEPRPASLPERRSRRLQLNLVIAGVGTEGCDVEVKPGNASCKFRPIYGTSKRGETGQHIGDDGRGRSELRDVELRGADRTSRSRSQSENPSKLPRRFTGVSGCPSKPEASRGLRSQLRLPSFTCYLSSPSKLAKADESRTRK